LFTSAGFLFQFLLNKVVCQLLRRDIFIAVVFWSSHSVVTSPCDKFPLLNCFNKYYGDALTRGTATLRNDLATDFGAHSITIHTKKNKKKEAKVLG
jgi:hypothetical protein